LWSDREHARRAKYVRDVLPDLVDHGVEFVGGVSRNQLAQEYSEAMVLAYPVDTIAWTEGFAVAILEGCASGAVPCISSCDAIGSIYGGVCPMVEVIQHCRRFDYTDSIYGDDDSEEEIDEGEVVRNEWTADVVRMLTDGKSRDKAVRAGRE